LEHSPQRGDLGRRPKEEIQREDPVRTWERKTQKEGPGEKDPERRTRKGETQSLEKRR